MELNDQPQVRIYADMDGVIINSRNNVKRMEGKVALVWSERELAKADNYAITDKRYMGSFVDMESLNWEIVSELYKRSCGNLDSVECLVRGDRHGYEDFKKTCLGVDIYWIIIIFVRR